MQVPAGGEEVRQRGPAHERGQQPAPLADLLDRRPEQHRRVGRGQPGHGREAELELTRAPLVLDRARRQADVVQRVPQRLQCRPHAVQPHLGQELVTALEHADRRRGRGEPGVLRRQLLRRADDDAELDLEPGQVVVPGLAEVGEHPAEQAAAVQRHRLPVAEVDVAQHPAGPVRPRQHPEGARVGHHDHVGEPGELRDPEPATARERGHEHLVAGVQAVDRAGEVEPVGHRRYRRRGDIILPRGTPCWSTTASRTVRRSSSRIRAVTSSARGVPPVTGTGVQPVTLDEPRLPDPRDFGTHAPTLDAQAGRTPGRSARFPGRTSCG